MDVELARRRLVAQGLITPLATSAERVVAAFGAHQGQDLPGAIASIALRLESNSVQRVIEALDQGEIVRGYVMRGTVFMVSAADVTWITELCADGPKRASVGRRSQLGLEDATVAAAQALMLQELTQHPRGLSRADLMGLWDRAGIPTSSGLGYHMLTYFMHDNVVCWGPFNGQDQNVVSCDAWLPAQRTLEQRFNGDTTAATAELLRRYLTSHGPATIRDFAWWTKLPLRLIRAALSTIEMELRCDGADDPHYWDPELDARVAELGDEAKRPLLLPGFDEFILGYPNRQFAMTPEQEKALVPGNNGVFKKSAIADGVLKATWTRKGRPGKRSLVVDPLGKVLVRHQKAWETRFGEFPFVAP